MSKASAIVDSLLNEAVCGYCGQECGDQFFKLSDYAGRSKGIICGKCHLSGKDSNRELPGHAPDRDEGDFSPDFGYNYRTDEFKPPSEKFYDP